MSGGSYNYAYLGIDQLATAIRTSGPDYPGVDYELRAAFKRHLLNVAAACRAIEWNDSGDGDSNEADLIRQALQSFWRCPFTVTGGTMRHRCKCLAGHTGPHTMGEP